MPKTLLLCLLAIGCGGSSAAKPDASAGAGGGGTAGTSAGTGGTGASAGAGGAGTGGMDASAGDTRVRDWSRVEALLLATASDAGVSSLGLTIWDRSDARIYERMVGGVTADTRVAIASASKMVSGLVLFDEIRRGELTLDSTTGGVLQWTGANAAITLRQLLSFTSGLEREDTCTVRPLITLDECVATIRDAPVVAAPGAQFDYGSTHLQVAARMAEVASGKSWAQLFSDTVRTPLGFFVDVVYFTAPKQQLGSTNPLVAGGLRASMNEYANFLALVFHRGAFRGLTIGTPALYDEQSREVSPAPTIDYSPVEVIGLPYHYGLTAWLMCATPATGCEDLSSPGAFGFTPWLDRASGYYAILGMELDRDSVDTGVVDFAVKLQQELEPLIREQL
jgi:D-alanyl-D-alanine-carboxypeptidase/D-alanyl-D-alanine-endopeptidase